MRCPRSALSSPASAALTSGSSARVGKRGGRLRSTTSQLAFWPDIGPTCHATETFARSASTTSSQSTSSRAASPARTSRSQGKARVSTVSAADCGSSTCGSCRSCDPLGYSLRTSLLSALEAQTRCSMAWQRRATPAGRSWWVLAMSERRIEETESGSWRTPQAADGTHNHCEAPAHQKGTVALPLTLQVRRVQDWTTRYAQGGTSLSTQTAGVESWPTPASRDWRDDGDCPSAQERRSPCLPAAVSMTMWPTATATDAKASGAAGYSTESGRHSGTTLTDATVGPRGPESRSTTGKSRARLNHRWVAQLMGFPSDWLEGIDVPPSKPSATASSRKSSKPSDEQSEV